MNYCRHVKFIMVIYCNHMFNSFVLEITNVVILWVLCLRNFRQVEICAYRNGRALSYITVNV
jgi:hypothetical protein